MSGLLRSELLKQRTTRTILQLPLWMVGLVLLIVVLHVVGFSVHELSSRENQLRIYGWGTGIGSLFAALLGALGGGEVCRADRAVANLAGDRERAEQRREQRADARPPAVDLQLVPAA
jgi:hypothetical protein